jgi:hypothetical protein
MDRNKYDLACASDNILFTTCSAKVGPKVQGIYKYGVWSPDRFGSVYKGSSDASSSGTPAPSPESAGDEKEEWREGTPAPSPESSWIIPSGTTYPDEYGYPVGYFPDCPDITAYTCTNGTTNTGWSRHSNKYGLPAKCPDGLYTMTRTVTTGGSTAGDVTFEANVFSKSLRQLPGCQIKVAKRTTRRLGDERRLRSLEEAIDGWSIKYEHTAEAPADFGSASAAPSGADATGSKTGTTAAVAVGAIALVVGAVALAALFAGRQQEEQGRELELSVALATDEPVEL